MHKTERGAVSIFIVVFSALLITVVTVSFVRLMLQTEQEASTVDLSQSAYDSAIDGVEDAKRAIASVGNNLPLGTSNCNQVQQALSGVSGNETIIQQNPDDADLSQAYTCVIVSFSVPDYEQDGVVENAGTLIPLKANGASYNKIRIGWKRPGADNPSTASLRSNASLPVRAAWGTETPALLRVRLVWAKAGSINLNSNYYSIQSNAYTPPTNSRTQFLLPADGSPGSNTTYSFINGDAPSMVECLTGLIYECTVDLTIGGIGGLDVTDPTTEVYLQVTPIYKAADIAVQLLNSSNTIVPFQDVQAAVDSTGRAGDVFRRVQARVQLGDDTNAHYPSDALVLNGYDLCKNFAVTNTTAGYAPGACDSP